MLLVPVGESLLYVRPLYTQAAGPTAVPELKKVIVTFNGNSYMRDTLGEALQAAFGEAPPVENPAPNEPGTESPGTSTPPNSDQSVASLLAQADAKFREADAALKTRRPLGLPEGDRRGSQLGRAGGGRGGGRCTDDCADHLDDIGQRGHHDRRIRVAPSAGFLVAICSLTAVYDKRFG